MHCEAFEIALLKISNELYLLYLHFKWKNAKWNDYMVLTMTPFWFFVKLNDDANFIRSSYTAPKRINYF